MNTSDAIFDRCAEAQGKVISAGRLLRSAALALRSAEECSECSAPSAAVRVSALKLAKAASDAIHQVLDARKVDDISTVDGKLYNAFGLVTVIVSALQAPRVIVSQDLCTYPIADALEIAAEFIGEELDEGLAGKLEEQLHTLNLARAQREREAQKAPRSGPPTGR